MAIKVAKDYPNTWGEGWGTFVWAWIQVGRATSARRKLFQALSERRPFDLTQALTPEELEFIRREMGYSEPFQEARHAVNNPPGGIVKWINSPVLEGDTQ